MTSQALIRCIANSYSMAWHILQPYLACFVPRMAPTAPTVCRHERREQGHVHGVPRQVVPNHPVRDVNHNPTGISVKLRTWRDAAALRNEVCNTSRGPLEIGSHPSPTCMLMSRPGTMTSTNARYVPLMTHPSSFFVSSGTPILRGFGAPHQDLLGSVASYYLTYADVRTF